MNDHTRNSPDQNSQASQFTKSRWLLLMNLVIAIVILTAAILLKDSASHYQPRSAFDSAYIAATELEADPEILQNGILRTEAARAHAYRSIIRQSNGTFVIGMLVALAFAANAIYIHHATKARKLLLRIDN